MPASLVRENVQYYSQYIDGEVEKGCTEKEAVAKLGAPRLIAKTLLEAFEKRQGRLMALMETKQRIRINMDGRIVQKGTMERQNGGLGK